MIPGSSKSADSQGYSLRNRKSKATSSTIISPSEKRTAFRKEAGLKRVAPGKVVTKTHNPLDALLSEKRQLEKSGKSSEAFMQAESTIEVLGTWTEEDAGGDEILEEWQDESAVRNMIQEMLTNDQSYFEENDAQDVSLDAEGAANIIGINGSKVADILKRDRTIEEPVHSMLSGPRLWVESGNNSDNCTSPSFKNHTFKYSGGHPVISALKTSLDKQGISPAIMVKICIDLLRKRSRTSNFNIGFWDSCKYRPEYLRITPIIFMRTRSILAAFSYFVFLTMSSSILSHAGHPFTTKLPFVIVDLRRSQVQRSAFQRNLAISYPYFSRS